MSFLCIFLFRNEGLSVALFAPSWTYELPFKETKASALFPVREQLFWRKLLPYLYLRGPKFLMSTPQNLLFTSGFCSGCGAEKAAEEMQKSSKEENSKGKESWWLDLTRAEFQSSFIHPAAGRWSSEEGEDEEDEVEESRYRLSFDSEGLQTVLKRSDETVVFPLLICEIQGAPLACSKS